MYRMPYRHASLDDGAKPPMRVSVQAVEMRTVPEIAMHQDTLARSSSCAASYEQIFIDVVEEGLETGEFRDVDSGLAVKAALGSLNWIPIWYTPERGSEDDIDSVADSFARFILNGLKGS